MKIISPEACDPLLSLDKASAVFHAAWKREMRARFIGLILLAIYIGLFQLIANPHNVELLVILGGVLYTPVLVSLVLYGPSGLCGEVAQWVAILEERNRKDQK